MPDATPQEVSDAQKVAYWVRDTIAAADDSVTIEPTDHCHLTMTLPNGKTFTVQVDEIAADESLDYITACNEAPAREEDGYDRMVLPGLPDHEAAAIMAAESGDYDGKDYDDE